MRFIRRTYCKLVGDLISVLRQSWVEKACVSSEGPYCKLLGGLISVLRQSRAEKACVSSEGPYCKFLGGRISVLRCSYCSITSIDDDSRSWV
jgi:hypothetical protein